MVGETEGVFVINLARRHDRRAWMTTTCLDALQVAFYLMLSSCPPSHLLLALPITSLGNLQSVAKTSLFDAVSVDELEINENLLISARDRNFAPVRTQVPCLLLHFTCSLTIVHVRASLLFPRSRTDPRICFVCHSTGSGDWMRRRLRRRSSVGKTTVLLLLMRQNSKSSMVAP
jgi:hypothetical protein